METALEVLEGMQFDRGYLSPYFVTDPERMECVNGLSPAQPHAPVVTMSVTLPDGRTQELTAPESGLATLQLKDGSEYGFRPTIQDSSPWNRIVVNLQNGHSQFPDYGLRGAQGDERRSCRRVEDDTFVQSVRLSSIAACD